MKHLLRLLTIAVAMLAPDLGVLESSAQITYTEGFENSTSLPTGWSTLGTASDWTFATSMSYPSASPQSGSRMAEFNSFNIGIGGTGSLVTPVFTLAGIGANTATVSLYMYRDATSYLTGTYSYDSLAIYINTVASLTGATFVNKIARVYNYAIPSTVSGSGWYQYTFNIPSSYTAAAPATNYLIFKGYSSYGDNFAIDNISWTSYPIKNNESFEGGSMPPTGWTTAGTASDWTNVTSMSYPSATPQSGSRMAEFNSFNISIGGTGTLITPSFSLVSVGSQTSTVSLWMYRDATSYLTGSYSYDSLAIYVNTVASLTGATFINKIARVYNYAIPSTVSGSGWYQYTFNLPSAYTALASATNYLLFKGYSSYGDNFAIDNITWTTYPSPNCSGLPTAPTITSSVISAPHDCGYSATITGTNTGNSGGGHFQLWQSAPTASGPWTTISGANGLSYTTPALSVTTYYRFADSCGNSNLVSGSTSFTVPINQSTSVSIASGSGTTVCTGAPTIFTATATNGGSTPGFQWQKNGVSVGTNLNTYTDAGLVTGDSITCVITSNASCVLTNTATSNFLKMTVFNVLPTVNVTANPNTTICPGTSVLFTASATNQGAGPTYQWYKNGSSISGATSSTYTDNGLYNSDAIYVAMTSNAQCAAPATVTSNLVTVNNTTPISISSQPAGSVVCNGNGTIFSVTASAGSAISYQWMVNTGSGFTAITNGGVYSGALTSQLTLSSSTLTMNGYQYRCVMNATCALSQTNVAILDVNMPPNIVVQPTNSTTCTNTNANFSVTANGNSLTYQWMENNGGGFANITNGGVYSGATTNSLTLTNPAATMSGYQYKCVVSGSCSPTLNTSNVTLTVNSLPAASAPVNSTICAGGNTNFSITGSGTNATYQWQVNGSNVSNIGVYSGALTNTLTITGATAGMNGNVYLCIVSGACTPNATSAGATLNVYTAPAIAGAANQPQNTIICPGGNATFTANVTGAGLTYQWYENSIAVNNGGIYSGATSNVLTLTSAANTMNNNQYYCVISGNCTPPLTSSTATLTFYTVPGITVQPQAPAICQGTNGTISLTSSGSGITYQWMVNQGAGFVNASGPSATTATLSLTSVTTGMQGYTYKCVVSGTCQSPVTSNIVSLTVNTNPNITGQPPLNDTICQSSNGTLAITATGTGLSYQWRVNTGSGYTDIINNSIYGGATTNTLSISGATINMSGYLYKCNVTGTCSTPVLSTATLFTVDTLPGITIQPVNTNICVTSNGSLTVSAVGSNRSYQWMVDNGSGFVNVPTNTLYSGGTTNTLNFTAVPLSINNYHYKCVVSGICTPGAASNVVTLQVYTPPSVLVAVKNDTVCENGVAVFTVGAVGSVLNYQWQINTGTGFVNIPNALPFIGVGTPQLSINGVSLTMSGNTYRCVISGACTPTDTSNFGQLTVNRLPVITGQPVSSTICNGASTSFTVAALGAGISYLWSVNNGTGFQPVTNGGMYSGATSATLSISGASNTMAGYIYHVVVSGTCLPRATSNPDTLMFHPDPSTVVTTTGATTFCAGDSVILHIPSGNTYQWQLNGNDISGATNASYKATTSGYYVVKATSSFGCVSISPTTAVTAVAIPASPINTILGNLTFCDKDSVVFGTNTDPGLLYQWYNNNTAITAGTGVDYTAKVSGTYKVAVSTIVGPATCTSISSTLPVVVNVIPVDSVTLSGPYPIVCTNGGSITLASILGAGQTYTNFQWKQNGLDINGATASSYTATAGGWYNVAITNNLGCTVPTKLLYIQAVTNPSPVIVQQGGYDLYAGYFVNATYQWYFNSSPVANSNNATLHVTQNGTYSVSVTDSTLCAGTSPDFYLVNVGVSNVTISGNDVKVYPNPATTIVNIDAPVKVKVTVMSMQGAIVMSKDNAKTLDISHLANGVYMVQVWDENNILVKTERLVKSSW